MYNVFWWNISEDCQAENSNISPSSANTSSLSSTFADSKTLLFTNCMQLYTVRDHYHQVVCHTVFVDVWAVYELCVGAGTNEHAA